jgi:hypothetical protein
MSNTSSRDVCIVQTSIRAPVHSLAVCNFALGGDGLGAAGVLFGLKSAEGEVAAAARECGLRDLYCENLYESCMWASREGLGIG